MNEIITNMLERRSYRKYEKKQIPDDLLNQILEVALFAPNAGSGQRTKMLVCQNEEVNQTLGKFNKVAMPIRLGSKVNENQPSIIDNPDIQNAFYDAPTVITFFALKNFLYSKEDSAFMAENILLAAQSLGLGGCYVGRAKETFNNEYGKKLMEEWELIDCDPIGHVILGYPIGVSYPKPRKEKRIKIIK